MIPLHPLEVEVLAHRYLYYIADNPVITDYAYDMLEKKAQEILSSESAVHKVGSSLEEDYSHEVFTAAMALLRKKLA